MCVILKVKILSEITSSYSRQMDTQRNNLWKIPRVSCEHRALGQAEKLNRLNSNKKSTSSCFPSLMAILPFLIDSKVSILLLVSRSRTISEPKVVRFSMSRHAWNYQDLWELEEQRASCEFEAVRARHEFRDRRRRSRPLYPWRGWHNCRG